MQEKMFIASTFYQIKKEGIKLCKRQLTLLARGWLTSSRLKRVVNYVVNRQNEDGGYTFCQGIESNAQDTYYGLAILDLLGVPFPNVEKTVKWLRSFAPKNLYSYYYIAKALKLCGEELDVEGLKKFLSLSIIKDEFRKIDVYVEVASEFLPAFMIVELSNMVGAKIDRGEMIDWLLSFKNDDGGFGAYGRSNLNSTYYVLASLSNLGYPVRSLDEILGYIRACEKPYGGFTVVPSSSHPKMEHIYYGISALSLLGEPPRYPRRTAEFVLKCQNANGGFARSHIGISTFENTFYAVSVLQAIGEFSRA